MDFEQALRGAQLIAPGVYPVLLLGHHLPVLHYLLLYGLDLQSGCVEHLLNAAALRSAIDQTEGNHFAGVELKGLVTVRIRTLLGALVIYSLALLND